MKNLINFIGETRFKKSYDKDKLTDTTLLENSLKDKLQNKEIVCNILFDGNTINLNIVDNLKEGVVGHIIESVLCDTIEKFELGDIDIKNAKNKYADIRIGDELWEIKSFNKDINEKTGTIRHGITFTASQISAQNNPMIFVQYGLQNNNIIIKDIFCRYPDEVTYSKGNSTRGTVVKFS